MKHVILQLSFRLPFSWNGVKNYILEDAVLLFIWLLIISFIVLTVVILNRTIYIRTKKNQKLALKNNLEEKYFIYLSEIASGNYDDKALELMASNKETTLSLEKDDFTKSFHRRVLLKAILELHRNLAGESAYKLREVYLTLGYKQESLNKLNKKSWIHIVEGIQELNQMDIKDGYKPIFSLINHKHPLVRLEAILARIKMDICAFQLFDELNSDLTEWEQLRIHNAFAKLPNEEVPDFGPLLENNLESIQAFGIKMIAQFNQSKNEKSLIGLYSKSNLKIQLLIIESLAAIGSENSVQHIHQYYHKAEEELQLKMIKTLLVLSAEDEAQFFGQELNSSNYDIQLAAAKALANLKSTNDHFEKHEADEKLVPIIEHAKEWRKL